MASTKDKQTVARRAIDAEDFSIDQTSRDESDRIPALPFQLVVSGLLLYNIIGLEH